MLAQILKCLRSLVLVVFAVALTSCQSKPSPEIELIRENQENEQVLTLLSSPLVLDRPFESMEGPYRTLNRFQLTERSTTKQEVTWLKSIQIEAVTPQGEPASSEYFCHANLFFSDPAPKHNAKFQTPANMSQRLFTLAEGRLNLRLPTGFGIPIIGGTKVGFDTMSHHLNYRESETPEIRFKATVKVLNSDLEEGHKLKPVFRRTVYVYDKNAPSEDRTVESVRGEYCGSTEILDVDITGLPRIKGNPIHWMVPPGEHIYEIDANEQLALPFDTTLHYASAHFHNYCAWLRLVDLDSGQVLLNLRGSGYPGQRGMAAISDFESLEGLALRKNGNYRLRIKYDNPTSKNIDAMGILYLYLQDKTDLSLRE